MRDLYYSNDHTRGVHRTALWLVEEVGELTRELKRDPSSIDKAHVGEEMADIYAWVASLANLLDIDLNQEINRKYPGVCRKCNHRPCECKKDLSS